MAAQCVLGRASAVLSSSEAAIFHLQDQGLDCGSSGQGGTLETSPWGAGVSAGCLTSTSVHTGMGAGSGEPCGVHVWSPPASAEHPAFLSGGTSSSSGLGELQFPRGHHLNWSESQCERQRKTEGRPLPLCFRMKLRTRMLGLQEELSKTPKHRLSTLTVRNGAGFSPWAKLLLQREVEMQGWG